MDTPGHTPGSISYLIERNTTRYLFAGDAAFEKDGKLFVNKGFALDYDLAEESLRKIMGLKPVTVLPGHGRPVNVK